MSRLPYCRSTFRPALLLLLMFGLIVTPILDQLGDLHGAEHAAAQALEHGHAHASVGVSGHEHPGERESDHRDGSHGLLHLSTGIIVALPDAPLRVVLQPVGGVWLPIPIAPALPGDPSSLPFRPPIV